MKKLIAISFFLIFNFLYSSAHSQQVLPNSDFLLSMEIKFSAPAAIDKSMRVFNISSGIVSGPNIRGTVLSPSGDWVQILPSGVIRLDVRLLIRTDDGEMIYVSYNGVLKHSEKSLEKLKKGEEVTAEDDWYFVATPTFRTSSTKYDYLNNIQAINTYKIMRMGAEGGYARLDMFALK